MAVDERTISQESEISRTRKERNLLVQVGIITAFATLAFLGTTVIRIPIPATGGYFNLGDTFVMAAALLFGPLVGGFVGLIGPTISDAIGFPQFILATALIKFSEGFLIGLIARKWNQVRGIFFALAIGIIILVGGYFVFEAYLYPPLGKLIPFFAVTDFNAALAEIVPNLIQGTLSAVLAFGIWRLFRGIAK